MIVYRLSKSKYSADLSGKGAEKAGGRWNSKGVAMVYTSASRALCTAEVSVHVPLGIVPVDYELVSIEIPDDSVTEVRHQRIFQMTGGRFRIQTQPRNSVTGLSVKANFWY